MIIKATENDIQSITELYNRVLDCENAGHTSIGWVRGVYPTRNTVCDAVKNDSMYILKHNGKIVAAAKIDKVQMPVYSEIDWAYKAPDDKVLVMHTLAVEPNLKGRGFGSEFVRFYHSLAKKLCCTVLRIDTNATNKAAFGLYLKLGFKEAGRKQTTFNGIENVTLICLEKPIQ